MKDFPHFPSPGKSMIFYPVLILHFTKAIIIFIND